MTKTRKLLCTVLSTAVMIATILSALAFGTVSTSAEDTQPITFKEVKLGEFTAGLKTFSYADNKLNIGLTYHHLDESAELILVFRNSSDKNYYISSVHDTNENSYLSLDYTSIAGIILNANSDTEVSLPLKYSNAVTAIDERNQAFNSDVIFEFTEYVYSEPDPDIDSEPDPVTDLKSNSDIDPVGLSETNTNSESVTNAIPKLGDIQIGYVFAAAVCALLVIAVLISGKKSGLFVFVLAILFVMPISAKADEDTQNMNDVGESESISSKLNISGTIELNDKLTVTYDYDDGSLPEVHVIDYLGSVPSPSDETPIRDGYTFDGWYDYAENEPGFYSQVGYDLTFKAKWTANTYTITYNLNDGVLESANPTTYKITDPDITLNNPTKSGYYFIGWREDETSSADNPAKIESGSFGDRTFIAAFTPYLSASIKKYSANDTKVNYVMASDNKTYLITQAANSSGRGADGAVCDNSGIQVAWGDTYHLEFTLMLNNDCRFMIDPGCTISDVSGNDVYGDCRITIDGVKYDGNSDSIASGVELKTGLHKIEIYLVNNNFDLNPNADDFVDCTTFGLKTGSSSETYEIRDLKAADFIA